VYWLDNIDKYIEHYGSPAVQQRGRTLFNIGGVRNIDYDTTNNKGTVEVMAGDSFEVTIDQGVNSDFRNIQTSCTCAFENGLCKHQVASLLALKKKFQYNSAAIMGIINQTNTLHNSSKELDVDFFVGGDRVTTRCTCNKQVIDLCIHQQKVVHHVSFDLGQPLLFTNFPDTDELRQKAAEDYGLVAVSDVDTFFTLTLTTNGPEFVPKDKELLSFSDHLFLVNKVQQIADMSRYNAITSDTKVEATPEFTKLVFRI